VRYIKTLEADLEGIDGITEVNSPVDTIIKRNNGIVPNDIETVKEIYNSLPGDVRNKIFNHDYSMVVVNAYTDAGGDQKKLMEILEEMERRVEDSPVPPGVEECLQVLLP